MKCGHPTTSHSSSSHLLPIFALTPLGPECISHVTVTEKICRDLLLGSAIDKLLPLDTLYSSHFSTSFSGTAGKMIWSG